MNLSPDSDFVFRFATLKKSSEKLAFNSNKPTEIIMAPIYVGGPFFK